MLPAVCAWLEHPAQVKPVEAVIVLGGDPRRKKPNTRSTQCIVYTKPGPVKAIPDELC
jgi:hypothetical protein